MKSNKIQDKNNKEEKNKNKDNKNKDKKNKEKEDEEKKIIEAFQKNYKGQVKFSGKIIGEGGYNRIYDVTLNNSIPGAGKFITDKNELEFSLLLKGKNVIRQHAVFNIKHNDKEYHLIIMEKANLCDISKLTTYLRDMNLLKNIFDPFIFFHENLLRFYIKEIVNGIKLIRSYNYVHLDIKPKNILVTSNLGIKLSDYSIMKNLNNEGEKIKIPGATLGYAAPEYFFKDEVSVELIEKIDIFGLGCTIYKLLTGNEFFNIPRNISSLQQMNIIRDQYPRKIQQIDSMVLQGINKDFIDLLKKLLKYNANERIDFEYIYRNKWINKYREEILKILDQNENEENIIMELIKSDVSIPHFMKQKKITKRLKKYEVQQRPVKKKYVRIRRKIGNENNEIENQNENQNEISIENT